VLSELRAEIAAASVSVPITDGEARKLPYLQAVIKEGLRIWPPVVGLMAKEDPPGGDEINGMFVPEGLPLSTVHLVFSEIGKPEGKMRICSGLRGSLKVSRRR
jgi:hypothetical protein